MSPANKESGSPAAPSSATAASVQGAKRRKPLKTSKVTQQQNAETPGLVINEEDVPEKAAPEAIASAPLTQVLPSNTALPAESSLKSMPSSRNTSSSSPPPPIPEPVITSTTVVTRNSDQVYKCPLCHEDLTTQNDFTQHIRAHNEVKPHPDPNDPTGQAKVYYCCLCSKMLSSFSSLDRHMLVHSGERPFSCELCGQTFTTNGNMHRHKRTHSAKELAEHNEAMGGASSTGKRAGRKRKSGPNANANNQHHKAAKTKADAAVAAVDHPEKLPDMGPQCPLCKEGFFTDNLLESHLLACHKGEQLKCDECSYSFPNYSTFKLHKLFHSTSVASVAPTSTTSSPLALPSLSLAPPEFAPHQFPQLVKAFEQQQEELRNGKPLSAFSPEQHTIVTGAVSNGLPKQFRSPKANKLNNNLCDPLVTPLTPNSALSQISNKPLPVTSNKAIREMERAAEAALKIRQRMTTAAAVASDDEENIVAEVTFEDDDDTDDHLAPNSQPEVQQPSGDLADVESILSVTRAGNLSCSNGGASKSDNDRMSETSSNVDVTVGSHDDADDLRDMKLKGEFPCRLCPAIYPNLRALKGHNKEHLAKAPYECNVGVCTYSSNDKSTLTRHMRTHTGEKPFECKLCNYGFTTKANCERHLKNKHGKTNREEIRDCLIIHDSEEPEPNHIQKMQMEAQREAGNFRCKVCKQFFLTSERVKEHAMADHPYYNDVEHIFEELRGRHPTSMADLSGGPSMVPRTSNVPSLSQLRPLLPSQAKKKEDDNSRSSMDEPENGEEAPLDLSQPIRSPRSGDEKPLTIPKPTLPGIPSNLLPFSPTLDPSSELLKNNAAAAMAMGLLQPLMLSTAAAAQIGPNSVGATPPQIPGVPNFQLPFPFSLPLALPGLDDVSKQRMQLQQQQQAVASAVAAAATGGASMTAALGDALKKQPTSAYSSANGSPLLTSMPLDVSSLAAAPIGPSDAAAVAFLTAQEALRKQQQQLQQQQQQAKCSTPVSALSDDAEEKEAAEALKNLSKAQTGLSLEQIQASNATNVRNRNGLHAGDLCSENDASADMDKGSISEDESNYKMVIKNGVLMRKQKQRRYRTERPYGCEYCKARFTLRSNMERHIKQQHPEHWSSKPRGSRKNHSATVPVLAPQFRSMVPLRESGEAADEDEDKEIIEIDSDGAEEEEQESRNLVIDDDARERPATDEDNDADADLASVPKMIKNTNSSYNQNLQKFLDNDAAEDADEEEEDDEEGAVEELLSDEGEASSSSATGERKKSAYSAAPHKISCPYCTRKFPWTSSLNRHILTHTGDKPFKCSECPLEFTTKSNCDRHQMRKHGHNNSGPSAPALAHVAGSENGRANGLVVPERPYRCQICPASFFSTEINRKRHQQFKHLQASPDEPETADNASSSYEDEEKENALRESEMDVGSDNHDLIICHVCEEAFPDRNEVIQHIKATHKTHFEALLKRGVIEKALKICEEEEEEEDGGNQPDEAENGSADDATNVGQVRCVFCRERFSSRELFRSHVRLHTGGEAMPGNGDRKPFACSICSKRFALKQSLVRHTRNHEEMGVIVSGQDVQKEALEENHASSMQLRNKSSDALLAAPVTKASPSPTLPATPADAAAATSDGSKKKRPSLMDTIAKLSSAKKQCK